MKKETGGQLGIKENLTALINDLVEEAQAELLAQRSADRHEQAKDSD